ncbi:RNA polymerase sigma factor RpoH [Alteromonas ponticola]|uniref:RNA polymerase sigma factor RpoH n=1 Tax=Alteromonas aquimaris TaxID=2998417 RepID=A0ABT3PBV3_9ALTE|nr:RNA polymerase sigma factor RpoH [Alteromonas aquimaris]MCW8109576.1 RNA polymerase sigma factor RpoH [Alteromonas aquimaris]
MNTLVTQGYLNPGSHGTFQNYVGYIQSIPFLTAEEEKVLFKKYHEENDMQAVKAIILSHLRFVYTIAKGYKGYGLPLEDMVQEGNIGLMKSVKKFDLSFECRLATYAVHFIKAEIHEYILNNWKLVKVATSKAKRKLFFNLRKFKQSWNWLTHDEASAIADELNVDKATVLEMESRLHSQDHYLGVQIYDEDEEGYSLNKTTALALTDHRMEPARQNESDDWLSKQSTQLHSALRRLDQRSQEIIRQRYLVDSDQQAKLQELGDHYGISAERVRQIETRALQKLKSMLDTEIVFDA